VEKKAYESGAKRPDFFLLAKKETLSGDRGEIGKRVRKRNEKKGGNATSTAGGKGVLELRVEKDAKRHTRCQPWQRERHNETKIARGGKKEQLVAGGLGGGLSACMLQTVKEEKYGTGSRGGGEGKKKN